jgi:dicarboxylate transporter 10
MNFDVTQKTITHTTNSRMQTGRKAASTVSILRASMMQSGFRSIYAGLSASLMRQMTYSLVRIGAYEKLKARISKDGKPPTAHLLLAAGFAGGLGGIAGNPAGQFHDARFQGGA